MNFIKMKWCVRISNFISQIWRILKFSYELPKNHTYWVVFLVFVCKLISREFFWNHHSRWVWRSKVPKCKSQEMFRLDIFRELPFTYLQKICILQKISNFFLRFRSIVWFFQTFSRNCLLEHFWHILFHVYFTHSDWKNIRNNFSQIGVDTMDQKFNFLTKNFFFKNELLFRIL
jgi:hypothetical protein